MGGCRLLIALEGNPPLAHRQEPDLHLRIKEALPISRNQKAERKEARVCPGEGDRVNVSSFAPQPLPPFPELAHTDGWQVSSRYQSFVRHKLRLAYLPTFFLTGSNGKHCKGNREEIMALQEEHVKIESGPVRWLSWQRACCQA